VTMISDQLDAVRNRMAQASLRAGRHAGDVRLIAVSKKVSADSILSAAAAGIRDFGENYVQEARGKIETLPDTLCWHMIGHLQMNKIKYLPGLFDYVHSIDRQEVLDGLDKLGKPLSLLFEVNLSGEPQKHGTAADGLKRMLERVGSLRNVKPVGLMTMAPYTDKPEEVRHIFADLRRLLEEVNRQFSLDMKELSMGMSSDFEVAIEEGATMVRIGTAIFGERI
jgi:pyridoxal phosphate enzyme (YggS family)